MYNRIVECKKYDLFVRIIYMGIQEWFDKRKEAQIERRSTEAKVENITFPGLWTKCIHCGAQITNKDLEENLMVCPECDYHFRIGAKERIAQLFDKDSFVEMFTDILPTDPLDFIDTESYKHRLKSAKEKTDLNEAVITGIGKIEGYEVASAIMDFGFMGGSMGSVVGEKVALIMEKAIEKNLPMLAITSSGGARMQESALSLMQMAKTSCACAKMDDAKVLYICLLTEPTYGGVTASFGTLGDIIIAEQGARIGFAGRRVIEKFGQVDIILKRKDLRENLSKIFSMHGYTTVEVEQ